MDNAADGASDAQQQAQIRAPSVTHIRLSRRTVFWLAMVSEFATWLCCFLAAKRIHYTPWTKFGPTDSWNVYVAIWSVWDVLHSNPPSQEYFNRHIARVSRFRADLTTGSYPNENWRDVFFYLRIVAWALMFAHPLSMAIWWAKEYGPEGPPEVVRTREMLKVVATSFALAAGMVSWDNLVVRPWLVAISPNRAPAAAVVQQQET